MRRSSRPITLTTDFGYDDAYVSDEGRDPRRRARRDDRGYQPCRPAPAVLEAAVLLELAWGAFPDGSVHVVVVDPGVGTARRRLAVASGGSFFVGPDNGCLSAALTPESRGTRAVGEAYSSRTVPLAPDVAAVAIEDKALLRRPVSATFEGRDVFAPAAAHLSRGGAIGDLGPAVAPVEAFAALRAPRGPDGAIDGRVVRVDRFGNLITDIRGDDLPLRPVFAVGGRAITGLARTYGEAGGLSALVGSGGFVEVALPNGSATRELGLEAGARVSVA